MGSKVTLKNSSNVELSIEHNDLLAKGKKVTYADTIEQLEQLEGLDDYICIVTDKDRGGIFIYDIDKRDVNDGGITFNGWVRQYDSLINVKWFGDLNKQDTYKKTLDVTDIAYIEKGVYLLDQDTEDLSDLALISSQEVIFTEHSTLKSYLPIKSNLDLLNRLKEVDGEDSGLDADKLDGKQSLDFDIVDADVELSGAKTFTSNVLKMTNLPTSDPEVDGQLWNDNGTLKISNG